MRTQAPNSKELTKMVTNMYGKCYQTFCRSKSKEFNELISKNSQKVEEYKDQSILKERQWPDYLTLTNELNWVRFTPKMIVLLVKRMKLFKMQTQEFLKLIIICTSKLNRNILLDCSLITTRKFSFKECYQRKYI